MVLFERGCHMGLGNNLMALEYARQAVMQEPYNQQYQQLVRMLESEEHGIRECSVIISRPLAAARICACIFCIGDMFCNLCFGGGYYC